MGPGLCLGPFLDCCFRSLLSLHHCPISGFKKIQSFRVLGLWGCRCYRALPLGVQECKVEGTSHPPPSHYKAKDFSQSSDTRQQGDSTSKPRRTSPVESICRNQGADDTSSVFGSHRGMCWCSADLFGRRSFIHDLRQGVPGHRMSSTNKKNSTCKVCLLLYRLTPRFTA